MQIIHDLPPRFPNNTYVALDTEIFQLNSNQMHRPISGKFACLTACADPETVYITQDEKDVPEFLSRLDNCIWMFHNAKFDLVHLRRWASIPQRAKIIDTMLVERILWNGYYDTFAEDDLARRYLSVYLDKTLQKSFEKSDRMTPEMVQYAVTDPSTLVKIWNEQRKHLTQTDMKILREIDMPCTWAILDFQGFRIDVEKWKVLAEKNKARQEEMDAQLPFNPRSNPQSVEFYSKNGFKGISNNQAETIEYYTNKYPNAKATPFARMALDSKNYGMLASRYGMKFIEEYLEHESDDVDFIKCNYWVIGAETSRMCVSGDTLLKTNRGIFRIDSIPLTSTDLCYIITHRGRLKPITHLWYKGKEAMFEVTLRDGSKLKCTKKHQILTSQGWKSLEEINVGDRICKIRSSNQRKKHNLGLGYIQPIIPAHRNDLARNSRQVQCADECAKHIYGILQNYLSRGDQKEKVHRGLQFVLGAAGKNAPKNKSEDFEQRYFDFTCGTGHDRMGYSQGTWRGCQMHSKKFSLLSSASSIQENFFTVSTRMDRFRNFGSIISRCNGRSLSGHRRSEFFLPHSLRCLCRNTQIALDFAKARRPLQLLSTKKENSKRLYFLENEQTRDSSIRKTSGIEYPAHPRVSLGQRTWKEICSGFLFSKHQLTCRNKRRSSYHRKNSFLGQRKNTTSRTTWYGQTSVLRQGHRSTVRLGGIYYSTEIIQSITLCGIQDVWDITVADDHSFVANGFISHNSASDPAMQQIPAKDTKDFRECFIARPEHKLIVADYSQQEIGIMAYLAQDRKMMDIFNSGQDIYIRMAKSLYGKDIQKDDPLRKRMKDVVLGMDYGMTEFGLAKKASITKEEATDTLGKARKEFPQLFDYMDHTMENKRLVRTLVGRKVHLNPYSEQCPRNALNGPVQGSAGDMLKKAINAIHADWNFDCPFGIVEVTHDEIGLDVPEPLAEPAKKFVSDIMIQTANEMCGNKMSFRVSAEICNNWSEKG